MKKNLIAHAFWAYAPHLGKIIARRLINCDERAVVYLRDLGTLPSAQAEFAMNDDWIGQIPVGSYGGNMALTVWRRWKLPAHLSMLAKCFLPEFSLATLWRIVTGPKYWVLHGWWLSPMTMLLMRLCGKKVVLIHWGGHWGIPEGRLTRFVSPLSFKLLHHMFVLMSPEIAFYKKWVPEEKLTTLPYWSETPFIFDGFVSYNSDRDGERLKSVIIGNSAWLLDQYDYILERMPAHDWDRIVCMLNYGQEWEKAKIDAFVEKWKRKFGDAFFAWRDRVPLDEYKKIMSGSPYYVCLHRTQVGLGAINNCVQSGKTIFIAGDNYEWCKEMGILVFNTDDLKDFSFESLYKCHLSREQQEKNAQALKDYYTKVVNKDVWFEQVDKALGIR